MRVNFRPSDFRRKAGRENSLTLRNRYFETNPFLSDDGAALLARPGLRKLRSLGDGPIRGLHNNPGSFDGDLFVASGSQLFRLSSKGYFSTLPVTLANSPRGVVNMASTAQIGDTPPYLFIADGQNLWVLKPGGQFGLIDKIEIPDFLGAIDVAVISSYCIVIPTQLYGNQGKFYWIEPGEITLDPLNFATAERAPDGITGIEVFGDQFWLTGATTTEVWYATGVLEAPMQRMQGIVLDRGAWQDSAVAHHETLFITDADGGVFIMQGGSPQRISTPDIEEEIRRAISAQQAYL